MIDIVERLRMTGAPNYQSPVCIEAADEIERLRAELAETISCRDVEEAAADAEAAELRERVAVLEAAALAAWLRGSSAQ